jgi:glycosyltransferase involved in cell wall biosynthesis
MRILHLRNVANVANVLSTTQRALGHDAKTLGVLDKYQAFTTDSNIGLSIKYGYSDIPKRIYLLTKNLIKNRDYDVFHLHDGGLFPRDIDVPLWFKFMGNVCVHWHGTKLRNKGSSGLSKHADHIFVSTPDLLKFENKAEWIPNPINLQTLQEYKMDFKTKGGPVRILHAPTNREIKGTNGIISKINELKREGLNVDFRLMENATHNEVLDEIAQADIIIDWINPNYEIYGMVSLEGMALEKPILCSINEEYRDNFYHGCPIVNADINSLCDKIRYLVEDESERMSLGKKGRTYVERMHDAVAVTKRILTFYN